MARVLQNPGTSCLLLIVLAIWTAALGDESLAGRCFCFARRTHCGLSIYLTIARTPDGDLALIEKDDPRAIGEIFCHVNQWKFGLFAPTERRLIHRADIIQRPEPQPLTASELSKVRNLMADQLAEMGRDAEAVAGVRAGSGSTVFPIESGKWINGCMALCCLVFCWSMGWLPRKIRQGTVQARANRRAAAGLCTTCGYDLHGTSSGICPECGHDRSTPA